MELDGRRLPLQLLRVAGLLVDRTLLASMKGMFCVLSESMIDRPGLGQDHEGRILQLLLPELVVLDGTTPYRIPRPLDVKVDEAGHAELLRLCPLEVKSSMKALHLFKPHAVLRLVDQDPHRRTVLFEVLAHLGLVAEQVAEVDHVEADQAHDEELIAGVPVLVRGRPRNFDELELARCVKVEALQPELLLEASPVRAPQGEVDVGNCPPSDPRIQAGELLCGATFLSPLAEHFSDLKDR